MLNEETFAKMMVMLAEVYQTQLTKSLNRTYYFLLQDMQDDDFKQAVQQMMKERTFATFPKPAEILNYSKVEKVIVNEVDEVELEAKRLIAGVHSMNTILFDEAKKSGEIFEDVVNKFEFKNVTERSMAILNSVKPYCDVKKLVVCINHYQTTVDAVNAFKSAIKQHDQHSTQIDGSVRKMIKGR